MDDVRRPRFSIEFKCEPAEGTTWAVLTVRHPSGHTIAAGAQLERHWRFNELAAGVFVREMCDDVAQRYSDLSRTKTGVS